MIALIKTTDTSDIICEPFPKWLDPIAFCVFDCYSYAACANYEPPAEGESRSFEFSTREIENPYKQSEEDPDKITMRIAVMT